MTCRCTSRRVRGAIALGIALAIAGPIVLAIILAIALAVAIGLTVVAAIGLRAATAIGSGRASIALEDLNKLFEDLVAVIRCLSRRCSSSHHILRDTLSRIRMLSMPRRCLHRSHPVEFSSPEQIPSNYVSKLSSARPAPPS